MDESVVDDVASIPGVVAVVPTLDVGEGVTTQTVTTRFGGTFTFNVSSYTVEGVPLNSSLVNGGYVSLPANITEGRNLESSDSGVVVLSENNTGYFGVGVGGEVNINGTNFQVVGVYGENSAAVGTFAFGAAADIRTLYMNLTDAQTVTGLNGQISGLNVYADSTSDVSTVAGQISSNFPDLTVNTQLNTLQMMQNTYNQTLAADESAAGSTQTVALEDIAVAVVATSLIVLFVMLYTVRERTKEIGTLKALGFSNWNVMRQFLLEGILLSLVAGIVGIAIGSIGAPYITKLLLPPIHDPFRPAGGSGGSGFLGARGGLASGAGVANAVSAAAPSPQLMLIAIGAAVVLGAVGSLYPAWRASRTRPAEAMRYE